MLLENLKTTKVSIDKIYQLYVWTSEFWKSFDSVGKYYGWFNIIWKKPKFGDIINAFSSFIYETHWIDGLQQQMKFRRKSWPEIIVYFNNVDKFRDIYGNNDSSSVYNIYRVWKINKMAVFFRKIAEIWTNVEMEVLMKMRLHS